MATPRVLAPALALSLPLAAPRAADACTSIPPPSPWVAEPVFEDPGIDVMAERLLLDCKLSGDRYASCTVAMRLDLRNPWRRSVETRGAVRRMDATQRVDVTAPASSAERAPGLPFRSEAASETALAGAHVFPIAIAGAGVVRILVQTSFTARRSIDPCWREGVEDRHGLFAFGPRGGDLTVLHARPLAGRTMSRERISFHVSYPRTWEVALLPVPVKERPRWALDAGDDDEELRKQVSTKSEPGETEASVGVADAKAVRVEFVVPGSRVWAGGPFAGTGYWFGPRADRGPHLRLGYEFAAPVWLLHAVAMETDAHRVFGVVPSSEAVTHGSSMRQLIFGAGAGVPVRIRPDLRAGARVQATTSFRFFTLRAGLDVYPPLRSLATAVEGSLVAQFSL
jgi:hypothetical protein